VYYAPSISVSFQVQTWASNGGQLTAASSLPATIRTDQLRTVAYCDACLRAILYQQGRAWAALNRSLWSVGKTSKHTN